jgi:blue copper oxidase
MTYNGLLPGPTVVARTGDVVSLELDNRLDEASTIHWHGLIVPTSADGQPQEPVPAGETRTYTFTVRQRAGFSFYHPHPHHATASQVAKGLAGGFIIRDAEEDALGLPAGAYEVPLVIRDTNIDSGGTLSYNGKASGFTGSVLLVNGTRDPYLDVDPAVYRFRLLGAANSRVFKLRLSTGDPWMVIGNDGGLLPDGPTTEPELEFSSGERLDVLVDLRGRRKSTVSIVDANSGWTILELRVRDTADISSGNIPTALPAVPALAFPSGGVTKTLSFDGMTKINGKLFDMDRIDHRVPAGSVERWVFRTSGNAPHPVHIHGCVFQVESRAGGRGKVFSWERGWKDTVLLQDGETVSVLVQFDGASLAEPAGSTFARPKHYLIHCHKLEHEDAGMMANFVVT